MTDGPQKEVTLKTWSLWKAEQLEAFFYLGEGVAITGGDPKDSNKAETAHTKLIPADQVKLRPRSQAQQGPLKKQN